MEEVKIICLECKKEFYTKRTYRKFCSCSCSVRYNNRLNKEKLSNKAKERFKNKPELRKKLSDTAKNTNSKRIYKPHSDETKRKISANNRGGRCSWYEFKKKNGDFVKIQGSYELRFAKILDDIDENWIKPTIWNRRHQFQWFDEMGKSHWYTPDFWSPKLKRYFEIKGFWTKGTKNKRKFIESLKDVDIIYKEHLDDNVSLAERLKHLPVKQDYGGSNPPGHAN